MGLASSNWRMIMRLNCGKGNLRCYASLRRSSLRSDSSTSSEIRRMMISVAISSIMRFSRIMHIESRWWFLHAATRNLVVLFMFGYLICITLHSYRPQKNKKLNLSLGMREQMKSEKSKILVNWIKGFSFYSISLKKSITRQPNDLENSFFWKEKFKTKTLFYILFLCLCFELRLVQIRPTRLLEFVRLEKNRVRSRFFCWNLNFRQSVMFEFKSRLGLGLCIRIRVVETFKSFRVRTNSDNWTIGFGHWTTRFMWNVGPNSLEIFIKIILDNWVRTLRNQVRIRSHKIRSECP